MSKLPAFANIEEEIQDILDTFGDVEIGESHAESTELSEDQTKALNDYLEMLAAQEADKADAFAQFCHMTERQIEALKAEAALLIARAKSRENTMKHCKMYYLQVMERHGLTKVSGAKYTLSRRGTKVCHVVDESKVPEAWMNVKVTKEPAKRDILAALKRGEEVPGCEIGTNYSLTVR